MPEKIFKILARITAIIMTLLFLSLIPYAFGIDVFYTIMFIVAYIWILSAIVIGLIAIWIFSGKDD